MIVEAEVRKMDGGEGVVKLLASRINEGLMNQGIQGNFRKQKK